MTVPERKGDTHVFADERPGQLDSAKIPKLRPAFAEDGTITATAINDYAVEIPMSDAVEGGPIIAYHTNGEEMSRRDKGPLWVVYPYDSDIAYQTELVYSRSIWQLDRISVE